MSKKQDNAPAGAGYPCHLLQGEFELTAAGTAIAADAKQSCWVADLKENFGDIEQGSAGIQSH